MKDMVSIPWQGWQPVRIIGRGAVGTVYEIRKQQFGLCESAAVKVLHVPADPEEIDEKLESGNDEQTVRDYYEKCVQEIIGEYSIMLKLRGNANIVYCDDIQYAQQENGIGWDVFIKMELLEALSKLSFPEYREEEVLRMTEDLCNGLIQCRRHSIIHRDIKPQNIFRSADGVYKLGDFGISTISENTATGTKTGTYEYMAPEVYMSQPYGATVDIYSLGLVMYWMMNDHALPFMPTGGIPTFSEKKLANDRRFRGDPFPPPAHGSGWLCGIMAKACAYRSEDRYSSAEEMLRDLKNRKAPKPVNLDLYEEIACEEADVRSERLMTIFAGGREVRFYLPSETQDGQQLQLANMGSVDSVTGECGSLYVTVHINPAPAPEPDSVSVPSHAPKKNQTWIAMVAAACIVCVGLIAHGLLKKDPPEEPPTEPVLQQETQPPIIPTEPQPVFTEPEETEPAPTEPEETEPAPTEPEETEPAPTEPPKPMVNVGDTITMGTYPQLRQDDYDTPVSWQVLDVRGDEALVISSLGLDSRLYHDRLEDVTWETSSLRNWLNGIFYEGTFTPEEQQRIISSAVPADYNPMYDTYAGGDTNDKIFILSLSEVERYLGSNGSRVCFATPYAVANNAFVAPDNGGCWWLIRTPGENGYMVASTNTDGSLDYDGGKVNSSRGVVRPAMWIKIG